MESSTREVERKYNKLMKDVATKEFYTKVDLTNRVNCYVCQTCKLITKTIDIDSGVTPFMHTCEHCGNVAYSSFYKDIAPHLQPTQEWYRPTLKQCLKMRNKHGILDHILQGGLDVRKIDNSHMKDFEKFDLNKKGETMATDNTLPVVAPSEEVKQKTYSRDEVEKLLIDQARYTAYSLSYSSAAFVYPRDWEKIYEWQMSMGIIKF